MASALFVLSKEAHDGTALTDGVPCTAPCNSPCQSLQIMSGDLADSLSQAHDLVSKQASACGCCAPEDKTSAHLTSNDVFFLSNDAATKTAAAPRGMARKGLFFLPAEGAGTSAIITCSPDANH